MDAPRPDGQGRPGRRRRPRPAGTPPDRGHRHEDGRPRPMGTRPDRGGPRHEDGRPRPAGRRPDREGVRDARTAALRVLTACRERGAWADAALRAELGRARLSPADAALCSRIVYGVVQGRMRLDFYLGTYCDRPLDRLQDPLLDILRIGAYQILSLDRIPDHAAVYTSVELARAAGRPRAAGLVDAVLRRLAASRDALPPFPDGAEGLSIRCSHPLWLVERMTALLGAEEAERALAANDTIPPLTVQVNVLRTDAASLTAELAESGIRAVPHAWDPGCLELYGTGDPASLPAFRAGKFYVQDPASHQVVVRSGIRPGQAVLDVCAAPGGKSFGAAIAMGDQGQVLACDAAGKKLRRVREGAARLGLTCIGTERADGRILRPEWEGRWDVVLVDAPCSGLGVIRKKPDIRYRDPAGMAELPALQKAVLRNAARYVRPGGRLVYSVCTILPEEGPEVVRDLLASRPDLIPDPVPDGDPEGPGRTWWPHRDGTDGFYLCAMTRRDRTEETGCTI